MDREVKAGFIILICAIIGFLLALIEGMAYDNGYLITQLLTDASQLVSLQILTIIMCFLLGGVLAAVTQG